MHRNRAIAAAIIAGIFYFMPPIVQDQSYHSFADGRTILGIPNFWNVVSSLPFAIVGLIGLWKLRDAIDRLLFASVLLTCFGSAYYHLAPSDSRLVWDRLPMTVVFMSTLACALSWEDNLRNQIRTLVIFVAFGIASVIWWRLTGDLRLYVMVQFGSLLLLLPSLRSVPGARFLAYGIVFYALAKAAEFRDHAIFRVMSLSGHTVKHLLSAAAAFFIYRWRGQLAASADARRKDLHSPDPFYL